MSWWGKLVGGAFGFMLGGPLGALLGAAVGHGFDRGLTGLVTTGGAGWASGDPERIQAAFFTATFSVMGHLAKADGQVSESEIAMARRVMAHLDLDEPRRQAAIHLFNEGKASDFPLADVLAQFRQEARGRRNLLRMFLEIQIYAIYADGRAHPTERTLLSGICRQLGISEFELAMLENLVRMQFGATSGAGGAGPHARPGPPPIADAYRVLGVPATADDAELKRAYRRLMNQHHPDKLVAKGLPQEMVRLATERTQQIKAAYEQIRKARAE